MYNIGFIGAGKMAFSLAKAIEKAKLADYLCMSDRSDERLAFIGEHSAAETFPKNSEIVSRAEVVFLAVKPQDMKSVLEEIKSEVVDQIIISIAAGVKISTIESILGNKKIVRVMPNTPCLVGEMAAGYACNEEIDEQDKNIVDAILNSAGIAIELEEEKLDAVTALSGSGPGFFARIIGYFIGASEAEGLERETAKKLAYQTMMGTAKLLEENGMEPEDLVKMVASPNGTTQAGLEAMTNAKIEKGVRDIIKAAADRSRELGKDD
jgi:pyrroline-5-carboxylate reductase